MMKRAREDIECALEVWAGTLPQFFGSRLEYVYAKGSATKPWDSHIDYVPTISDVDIHIGLKDDEPLLGNTPDDFDLAVSLSRQCEEEFLRRRPNHLHVPRMQVIETRFLLQNVQYTPPRPQDIQKLYGEPHLQKLPSPDIIRAGDLERISDEKEFVDDLPRRILDRTGLDWWAIIRTMSWRVSPSPVRILTQKHSDPLEVWSWNRTTIHRELLKEGYDTIASYYHGFYEYGWSLFLSEFKELSEFRAVVNNGYKLLIECQKEANNIRSK
ncbi:MAG: hypothetical protein KGD60_11900 [Candidatus Thorarchaeota archaeon]|nr:hypothetical protein [Candidatus Thorarchaeota archaeon]